MALINWSTGLEVGYPKIDEQHRTLVDAVNASFEGLFFCSDETSARRYAHSRSAVWIKCSALPLVRGGKGGCGCA